MYRPNSEHVNNKFLKSYTRTTAVKHKNEQSHIICMHCNTHKFFRPGYKRCWLFIFHMPRNNLHTWHVQHWSESIILTLFENTRQLVQDYCKYKICIVKQSFTNTQRCEWDLSKKTEDLLSKTRLAHFRSWSLADLLSNPLKYFYLVFKTTVAVNYELYASMYKFSISYIYVHFTIYIVQ